MNKFTCGVAFVVFSGVCLTNPAMGQLVRDRVISTGGENNVPTPYNFAYSSDDVEGSHQHTESGDGNGRVQGTYSINLGDGRVRTVNYVADENGYRAEVTTNELGTESQNPTDVTVTSSALSGKEAALQYGPFEPERQVVQKVAVAGPQIKTIQSAVALPSYGTFAGAPGRQ